MKLLTIDHITAIAANLNIDKKLLDSIAKVESNGSGYYLSEGKYKGELKVLFEGHYFYKATNGKFANSRPDLCYKNWTTQYYRKGQLEFGRLMEAIKLNKHSALLSASWGKFQIMGANFKKCGYASVEEMVTDFYKGEDIQFIAFLEFCENTTNKKYKMNLIQLLQHYTIHRDIDHLKEFVRNYNGEGQIEKYTQRILNNIS